MESLLKSYNQAYDSILKRMNQYIKDDQINKINEQNALKDINRIITKLLKESGEYSPQIIAEYYNARNEQIKALKKAGVEFDLSPNFGRIHEDVVKLLQARYEESMTRYASLMIQKTRHKILNVSTEWALKLETREFTLSDINNFLNQYSDVQFEINGKKMNARAYAKTNLNSVIDGAKNQALINTSKEIENDLLKMSYHASACPMCAKYENQVYSISGESKKYPALSSINAGNVTAYGIVHPNCRHRFTAFFEGYSTIQEQYQDEEKREVEYKKIQTQHKLNHVLDKTNRELNAINVLPVTIITKQKKQQLTEKIKYVKKQLKTIKE